MLREALIDEPWPWLSGEELMWRTGLFQVGFIRFASRQCIWTPGLTVQKQREKYAWVKCLRVHDVLEFGRICAASQRPIM